MSEHRIQPCPRCHAEAGWRANGFTDSRICGECEQVSSNTEISLGKPWTQDEIDYMLAHMNDKPTLNDAA